jgi:hypothetical protein
LWAAGADDIVKVIDLWKVEVARNIDSYHSAGAPKAVEEDKAAHLGLVRVRYADVAVAADYFCLATVRALKAAIELNENATVSGREAQLAGECSVNSGIAKVMPSEDLGGFGAK